MFVTKQLSCNNDTYYLVNLYNEDNFEHVYDDIQNITNHNSLNFLNFACLKMNLQIDKLKIIRKNCEVNNTSKPYYIHMLTKELKWYYAPDLINILNMLFTNEMYDMLSILFNTKVFLDVWFTKFICKYMHTSNFDNASKEIDLIICKKIMTPENVYKLIIPSHHEIFLIKNSLLTHIKYTYKIKNIYL
jgi:hypothetical protein